jgi:hypothetical protein
MLRCQNFLIPFNEHAQHKVESHDSWMNNMLIPEGESVEHGGLWVLEFFPPSRYAQLRKSLRRVGWIRDHPDRIFGAANLDLLDAARTGWGAYRWRLGAVRSPEYQGAGFATPEILPAEFRRVEFTAAQVGEGLTAVVGFFQFSDDGRSALNSVWQQDHEPTLRLRGTRRPLAIQRSFSAIENTLGERQRVGDVARDWMSKRLPGYFSEQPDRHPVAELLLFKDFNHQVDHLGREHSFCLRALGLAEPFVRLTSPEMPGLTIIPTESYKPDAEALRNSWGIAGQLSNVIGHDEYSHQGWSPTSAREVAQAVDRAVTEFLLRMGALEYVSDVHVTQSRARDLGVSRHMRFKWGELKRLRGEILRDGLDLRHMDRATQKLWKDPAQSWVPLHISKKRNERHSRVPESPSDALELFGNERDQAFAGLIEESEAYREVMATSASIGASIEASRLGRLAFWVAAASLVVAGATLLLASTTSDDNLWSGLIAWMTSR